MKKVVLASNNQGKLRELQKILSPLGIELLPQSNFHLPSIAETGLTFVENALIKARFASEKTGLPAIADDSGLEVDALGGAPGLYSARFAGDSASDTDNNIKLLSELGCIPENLRTARYRCVIVLLPHAHHPSPLISQGSWEGRILTEPRGEGGFGYDPLFWVASDYCSAAELSAERKNQLSHRGIALRNLMSQLEKSHG